jgi:hypothetical protein
MAFIYGATLENMKEIGYQINYMVEEYTNGHKAGSMKESTNMIKSMDLVAIHGRMVGST